MQIRFNRFVGFLSKKTGEGGRWIDLVNIYKKFNTNKQKTLCKNLMLHSMCVI